MSDELLIRTRDVLKERWLMAHEHRAFLIRDLAARVRELEAEREFLHKRRGELVIERDRYKATLAEHPDGRDVFLGGALAEVETQRKRAERAEAELDSIRNADDTSSGRQREALHRENKALRTILAGISGPCPTPHQWNAICDKAREIDAAIDQARKG